MSDDIPPPLSNGTPRVDYDATERGTDIPKLTVIVTEDMPVFLIAADSGLELVFEAHDGSHGYPWSGVIRAKRRDGAPEIFDMQSALGGATRSR